MLALSKSERCTCSNDDFTPSTVYTANHKASKQLELIKQQLSYYNYITTRITTSIISTKDNAAFSSHNPNKSLDLETHG